MANKGKGVEDTIARGGVPNFGTPPPSSVGQSKDFSRELKDIGAPIAKGIAGTFAVGGDEAAAKFRRGLQNELNLKMLTGTNKIELQRHINKSIGAAIDAGILDEVTGLGIQNGIRPEYNLKHDRRANGDTEISDSNGNIVKVIPAPKPVEQGRTERAAKHVSQKAQFVQAEMTNTAVALKAHLHDGLTPEMQEQTFGIKKELTLAIARMVNTMDDGGHDQTISIGSNFVSTRDRVSTGNRNRAGLEGDIRNAVGLLEQINTVAQSDPLNGPAKTAVMSTFSAFQSDIFHRMADPNVREHYGLSEGLEPLVKIFDNLKERIRFNAQQALKDNASSTATERLKTLRDSSTYRQQIEVLSIQLNWTPEQKVMAANSELLVAYSKVVSNLSNISNLEGAGEVLKEMASAITKPRVIQALNDIEKDPGSVSPVDIRSAIAQLSGNNYIKSDIALYKRAKASLSKLIENVVWGKNTKLRSEVETLIETTFNDATDVERLSRLIAPLRPKE